MAGPAHSSPPSKVSGIAHRQLVADHWSVMVVWDDELSVPHLDKRARVFFVVRDPIKSRVIDGDEYGCCIHQ